MLEILYGMLKRNLPRLVILIGVSIAGFIGTYLFPEDTIFVPLIDKRVPAAALFLAPALLYWMFYLDPPFIGELRRVLSRAFAVTTVLDDTYVRSLYSEAEQIERRLGETLRLHLDRELQTIASGENIVSKMLERRLRDGLIVSVDQAMAERVAPEGKKIRVQDLLVDVADRLRVKYDGPAARAEQSAIWSRRFSYFLAFSGLLVATYRVASSSGFTEALMKLVEGKNIDHFWPLVFAQAAPWVGLVILIEFTALIFFKFYVRSIELQRYFTRELANSESKFGALRVITELGTSEQSVSAALALMALQENSLRADFADDDVKQAGAVGDLLGKVKEFLPGRSTTS